MGDVIYWHNERRKLKDLKPWDRNPRQIKQSGATRLAQSYSEFGEVEPFAIGPDNEVYNGHQRRAVLLSKHGGDFEVDVRVASRKLTETEQEKLTILLHTGATGSWNWDSISGWDPEKLKTWGFDEDQLHAWNSDSENLREMLAASFTFSPETKPIIGSVTVEQDDIQRERDRINDLYSKNSDYVEVTCPHCAQTYFLNKLDLK